jgi:DNA polymerase-3 subunit gamma/tau
MSYKALYLTYRPQTFDEVAGQKAIVRTLKNALATGKMAHAYLFAGPRGTGKTTMARLLAKALDCEEGIGHQCNKCSNCLAISEGAHPDVIEIDAASNNGVDQVRDLIDKVKYAPIKGRYKVYIIDEVHMMSTGAFNALLKTLEEPPENVIFILCTTEPYKVLPTILSRCQRFDFGKLTDEEMKGKLVEVLAKEKAEYDENGIRAIISLADGGMRDALSILDQVLAFSGNKLKEEDVLAIFGLASVQEKIDLLKSVASGDVAFVMKKAESFMAAGLDIRRLVTDLIGILKDLLIYEKTSDATLIEEITPEQAEELKAIISAEEANAMITTLIEAQNDFKNVSDVRSLFELTLLRLASANPTPSKVVEAPKPAPKKVLKAEEAPEIETPAPKAETQPVPPLEAKAIPTPEVAKPLVQETKTEVIVETKPAPAPEVKKVEPAPEEVKPQQVDETEPPSFLFDEEKKPVEPVKVKVPEKPKIVEVAPVTDNAKETTTIDLSHILQPKIATEGMEYSLVDDEIIKIMVLANKAERTALAKKWHHFDELRGDPKIGNLASLLSDGHPFCICQDAIILSYNFTRRKKEANIIANQAPLVSLLKEIIHRDIFIYAIDRVDANRLTAAYFNLQTISKLPNKAEVKLNLPK